MRKRSVGINVRVSVTEKRKRMHLWNWLTVVRCLHVRLQNSAKRTELQRVPSNAFNAHANQIALTVKTKNNVQIIRAAESVPSSADKEVQWLT